MKTRFEEIDSLRGLAALSVLISHFLLIFPVINDSTLKASQGWLKLLKYSPLHLFWAGSEAVIFFFVLSGYVLSIPFLNKSKDLSYTSFAIKRIFRIYFPYLFAVIIAIITNYVFCHGGINELSSWFNTRGMNQVDFKLIIQHVLFLGSFDNVKYNPVLWSLIHEMRISLLFPLIVFFVIKYNWKVDIIGGLLISAFGYVMTYLIRVRMDISVDYFNTLKYIVFFIIGILLYKYRDEITLFVKSRSRLQKYGMIILAILAYTNAWWLEWLNKSIFRFEMANNVGTSLGVCIFIAFSMSVVGISRILRSKIAVFLGKISYSLYLYHCICLLSLIRILYGYIPIWGILIISFVSTLVVSTISYYWIELPFINLGKILINRNKKSVSKELISVKA